MCRENDLLVKMDDKNIVVVDDDETTLKIIKEIISRSLPECNTEYFNKLTPKFCNYVYKKDIDLYILDVKLGDDDYDGISLSEKIMDANQGSIFLFMSGYDYTIESFKDLTGKCIYDFMAKPFDTKGFIASVVALLNVSTTYRLLKKTMYNVDSARAHYAQLIQRDKEMIEDFKKTIFPECVPNINL